MSSVGRRRCLGRHVQRTDRSWVLGRVWCPDTKMYLASCVQVPGYLTPKKASGRWWAGEQELPA